MRCQWCGNANSSTATECAFCQKDLVKEQTIRDAVHQLETLPTPEEEIICPSCGHSNFLGTEFCDLCEAPLHRDVEWPKRTRPQPAVQRPMPRREATSWFVWIALGTAVLAGLFFSLLYVASQSWVVSLTAQQGEPPPPFTYQRTVQPPTGGFEPEDDREGTLKERLSARQLAPAPEKLRAIEGEKEAKKRAASVPLRPSSLPLTGSDPPKLAPNGVVEFPLPPGARLVSKKARPGYGTLRYEISRPIGVVADLYYENRYLTPATYRQGLEFDGSGASFSSRTFANKDMLDGEIRYKVRDEPTKKITISMRRLSANQSSLVIDYSLGAKRSVRLR